MGRIKIKALADNDPDKRGLPERVIRELVDTVERSATKDPTVIFHITTRTARYVLIPVLLCLYENGLCVLSMTATRRKYVLEVGKIDVRELERAAMKYASAKRLSGEQKSPG